MFSIHIPIAPNILEAGVDIVIDVVIEVAIDRICDRSRDSSMLIGPATHTDCFAIKLHLSLCMYMHRSTLVLNISKKCLYYLREPPGGGPISNPR